MKSAKDLWMERVPRHVSYRDKWRCDSELTALLEIWPTSGRDLVFYNTILSAVSFDLERCDINRVRAR